MQSFIEKARWDKKQTKKHKQQQQKQFWSEQWKEIEKNNRMGKTRDLLKKIGDIKGTFHVRMIKDRHDKELIETEEVKKNLQEYTKLSKKDLRASDNYYGVATHLEPDILECEVKWHLGRITMNKARGGDEISSELFQILKDDIVKVLHRIR